jgi:hypothetical protein
MLLLSSYALGFLFERSLAMGYVAAFFSAPR